MIPDFFCFLSVSTFYLNYNIIIVITMQKKGLEFKEVDHPELMTLMKTGRGEWFFLLNPYPSLSMKSDMLLTCHRYLQFSIKRHP
jgi:hypothetical protein